MTSLLNQVCSACKIDKLISEFHVHKGYRFGVTRQCKSCRAEAIKRWKERNPEKVDAINAKYRQTDKAREMWKRGREKHRTVRNEKMRAWHEAHPGYNNIYNLKRKLNSLGLSLKDYEALVARQGNVCAICGQVEANGHRLHIDHCHETGITRGLLCERHNLMLGYANDSPDLLRKAAEYLEKFQVTTPPE